MLFCLVCVPDLYYGAVARSRKIVAKLLHESKLWVQSYEHLRTYGATNSENDVMWHIVLWAVNAISTRYTYFYIRTH